MTHMKLRKVAFWAKFRKPCDKMKELDFTFSSGLRTKVVILAEYENMSSRLLIHF